MQAIIPVAGHGRRLAAVTQGQPKALLRVGGCTLVEHSLHRAQELGATELILVVRGTAIAEHLGAHFRGLPLRYVTQEDGAGLGHAVRCGARALHPRNGKDQLFLVICGDTWRSHSLGTADRHRFASGDSILNLVTASPPAQMRHSAAVRTDRHNTILHVEEKPPAREPGLAEIGIYRFPMALLETPVKIEPNGEETLQSMTNGLIQQGWPGKAVLYEGEWVNVNTPEDLALARRLATA